MYRRHTDAVMFQSVQRITEWRSSFGSGAITLLKEILVSKGIETAQGRKLFSMHMLGKGLPFTWKSFNSKISVRHNAATYTFRIERVD
jgi:hypothetical protein